jgi:DMSO/TMAO reductase YedYZ molybdopterin-dependent catalytic subunit
VLFTSHDGYTTNVPYQYFNDDDVLIAHSWNGKPIPVEHGGPVRIVLPKLYFWKSAKWVKRILFLERDQPGYWEVRGYHNVGDPWEEERYS